MAAHVALALALGALGGAVLEPVGEDVPPITMAFAPAADATGPGAEAGLGASADAGPAQEPRATLADGDQPAPAEPAVAPQPTASPAEAPAVNAARAEPAVDAATTPPEPDRLAEQAATTDGAAPAPDQIARAADPPVKPAESDVASAPVHEPLPVPPPHPPPPPVTRPPSRPVARPPVTPPAPYRAAAPKMAAAASRPAGTASALAPAGSAGEGPNSAGTGGRGGAPNTGAPDGAWVHGVVRWLQAHRTYPLEARQRGEQGSAVVRLTVARDGRVRTFTLVQSTGSARLDAAVEALLSHAELPPFPPSMAHDQATIQIPIRYQLAS